MAEEAPNEAPKPSKIRSGCASERFSREILRSWNVRHSSWFKDSVRQFFGCKNRYKKGFGAFCWALGFVGKCWLLANWFRTRNQMSLTMSLCGTGRLCVPWQRRDALVKHFQTPKKTPSHSVEQLAGATSAQTKSRLAKASHAAAAPRSTDWVFPPAIWDFEVFGSVATCQGLSRQCPLFRQKRLLCLFHEPVEEARYHCGRGSSWTWKNHLI